MTTRVAVGPPSSVTAGASLTTNSPTAVALNLLVLRISWLNAASATTATPGAIAGWTKVYGPVSAKNATQAVNAGFAVYTKIAAGGVESPTFVDPFGGTTNLYAYGIIEEWPSTCSYDSTASAGASASNNTAASTTGVTIPTTGALATSAGFAVAGIAIACDTGLSNAAIAFSGGGWTNNFSDQNTSISVGALAGSKALASNAAINAVYTWTSDASMLCYQSAIVMFSDAGGGGSPPVQTPPPYQMVIPMRPTAGGFAVGSPYIFRSPTKSTATTVFTQNLTAGITPSATTVKAGGKLLIGSITPGATVTKKDARLLIAGITPAGTLLKQDNKPLIAGSTPTAVVARGISKFLIGGITPSAAVSTIAVKLKALAGGITPTAAVSRRAAKSLIAGITPAGALLRLVNKPLLGGITPTATLGTIAVKLKALIGGIAPTAVLSARATKVLLAGLTPTALITRRIARSMVAGIAPTGAETGLATKLKALVAGITPTATLTAQQASHSQALTAGITPAAVITKRVAHGLIASITPTGTLSRLLRRALAAAITSQATVTKVRQWQLTGTITSAGVLIRLANYRLFLTAGMTPLGILSNGTSIILPLYFTALLMPAIHIEFELNRALSLTLELNDE